MDKKSGKRPDKQPEKKTEKIPAGRPETPGEAAPASQRDKNIRIAVVLLALAVLGCAVYFGAGSLQAPPSSGLTVYYFYGKECPSCHNTTPVVEALRQKYPDVRFELL